MTGKIDERNKGGRTWPEGQERMLDIIMEDQDIIVVRKPAGVESQTGKTFAMDLESEIRNYRYRQSGGGSCYVGVVHRLDRPVCGVMVYAKSKQAAADLSRQVREGMLQKEYHAILCGHMDPSQGTLEDWLVRDGRQNLSRVAKKGERGAKKALLRYETVPFGSFRGLDGWLQSVGADLSQLSLVRVELLTGRHHQIRVQFAHAGCPILGDTRYNPTYAGKKGGIQLGLCASRLSFVHPLTGQRLSFTW